MSSTTDVSTPTHGVPPTNSAPPDAPETSGRSQRVLLVLSERYGLVVLLIAVIVFFAIFPLTSQVFLSPANIKLTLSQQAVTLMIALAILPVLISGYYDLSVGAVTGISAIATASAMSKGHLPPLIAVLIGVAVGAAFGFINSFVVVKLGLNSFIATLAMATLIAGIVQWYTGGLPVQSNIPPEFKAFGTAAWFGIPITFYIVAAAALLTWYLLGYTTLGRYVHAIGSNSSAARLVGVPVKPLVASTFVWSGAMCGIAGVILSAQTAGANPQVGPDYLFPAFAAVFLGASAIRPGQFNVLGTVIGLLFLAFTISGITLAGADAWVQPFFNGLALLVAVGISTLIGRNRRRST